METSTSTIHQSHQQEYPPPAEDAILLNPEHSIENLLELINKQEEKINSLTATVAFLEQSMQCESCKAQQLPLPILASFSAKKSNDGSNIPEAHA